jgi:phosphatidylglycerol:prolipoprotein diacylglycerol transferase
MLHYPNFNPIAFDLGSIHVHWYGLMYLFSFMGVWALANYRIYRQSWAPLKNNDEVLDAIFYGAMGVILGGRVGYMLFYDLPNFSAQPLIFFKVWDGGMSFHGGLLGVILALWFYAYQKKLAFFELTDFFAPLVPIGLGLGRLGNFINGELWGRVTTSSLGMVFPRAGALPRYPSQLIELFLEGICLFIFLWVLSLKHRPRMFMSAWFLIGYSICRIIAEFFRQPDPQLGYLAFGWVTMGQLLSLPMFALGIVLLYLSLKKFK